MTETSLKQQQAPVSTTLAAPALRQWLVPGLLFGVTVLSTTAVGMRYMYNFSRGLAPLNSDADVLPYRWVWQHLGMIGQGLPFSLTLIAILLAHEFGHFFACRSFGVRSSLPYLLPAPSLSGTFGAVIRLQSRVRTRAALIAIGASGPIAGFVVAIVTVAIGLRLSSFSPVPVMRELQAPLLITLQAHWLHLAHPASAAYLVPHPVLVASWIGLLITALNLIPAGQLDGGHILYAISPRLHRICSRAATVVLFGLGIFFWGGWLLWGTILMLPGMKHPKVPLDNKLTTAQYALLPVCAIILLLAGTVEPFHGYSLLTIIDKLRHHHF